MASGVWGKSLRDKLPPAPVASLATGALEGVQPPSHLAALLLHTFKPPLSDLRRLPGLWWGCSTPGAGGWARTRGDAARRLAATAQTGGGT